MTSEALKMCTKCDPPQEKPLSQFPHVGSRWGPISDICRGCRRKEIANTWAKANASAQYVRHKEKYDERHKAWVQKNPERARAIKKQWKQNHPAAAKAYKKRRRIRKHTQELASEYRRVLRKKYGLTLEAYQTLLTKQGGKCAICGSTKPSSHGGKTKFAVDHHHDTGVVRGLLCSSCNLALGLLGEDIQRLLSAITYLSRHGLFTGGPRA